VSSRIASVLGCIVVVATIALVLGARGVGHDPVAGGDAGVSAVDDDVGAFAEDPSPLFVRLVPVPPENAPTPPGRIAVCELFRPPMGRSR
jgi:hypothetical protein